MSVLNDNASMLIYGALLGGNTWRGHPECSASGDSHIEACGNTELQCVSGRGRGFRGVGPCSLWIWWHSRCHCVVWGNQRPAPCSPAAHIHYLKYKYTYKQSEMFLMNNWLGYQHKDSMYITVGWYQFGSVVGSNLTYVRCVTVCYAFTMETTNLSTHIHRL